MIYATTRKYNPHMETYTWEHKHTMEREFCDRIHHTINEIGNSDGIGGA